MSHRTIIACAVVIASSLSLAAPAQPAPPQQKPRFGPWDRDLVIATSADGLAFTDPKPFVERGGVPHVARDAKGRLIAAFQWFPTDRPDAFDRVALRTSDDGGKTWGETTAARFKNLPPGQQRPFDPTLLLLDDGRLRMYFTSTHPDRRPPAIYSAVSTDGVNYTFEPGVRLAVDGEPVIDCAAVRLGKTTHLFSPVQHARRAYHAVSEDGVTFKRVDDASIDQDPARERNWLGCALATADGKIRFYGTGNRDDGWSATSTDGLTWKLDEGTRGLGLDPGVAPAGDGRFIAIGTGPNRKDAGQWKPARPPKNPERP
jgi:hypothetical protein